MKSLEGFLGGSILGPLFFSLYINDINNASNLLNLILFADDTTVFMSHIDLNYLSDLSCYSARAHY